MRRVLILGGGFGGVATAHALRRLLPREDEIVLIDNRGRFLMGFRKTWALVGLEPMEKGLRSLEQLQDFGIRVRLGTIDAIDPQQKAVRVDGERLEGHAMVVALGAELLPDEVPGFREHAVNFYAAEGVEDGVRRLEAFQGGRVLIAIFGAPYKCPPAPFEAAFLLKDHFEARGVEAAIEVSTPKPMSLPALGEVGCSVIEGRLSERGVGFFPSHRALKVEEGVVQYATARRPFDLLLGVPPHRAPAVVRQSGLTQAGNWVPVDKRTLETAFPDVYAIGDVNVITLANGNPHPKAGIFAERQGEVVAARIAARFQGETPTAQYDGRGHCFLELGQGEAMLVEGEFLAEPAPKARLTEPSPAYLEQKRQFERERLERWFGG